MKHKRLLIIGLLLPLLSGCVVSRNFREVTVTKDASGKIISTEYIERQEQRTSEMPFTFRALNNQ